MATARLVIDLPGVVLESPPDAEVLARFIAWVDPARLDYLAAQVGGSLDDSPSHAYLTALVALAAEYVA